MIIAIDFDGTCVTDNYPGVGENIGAEQVLRKLVDNNHDLILLTMRSDQELDHSINWFRKNNIPLYSINENPTQDTWTTSRKVYADLYIDDRSLGIPLLLDENSDSLYVDWIKIEELLTERGIING